MPEKVAGYVNLHVIGINYKFTPQLHAVLDISPNVL